MKFLKRSARSAPRISLVLIDWSVRESFHVLHYLAAQSIPRDQFEVIIIEYYGRQSPAAAVFEQQIDTWVMLEMPTETYYHKHLMYNVGIASKWWQELQLFILPLYSKFWFSLKYVPTSKFILYYNLRIVK